MPITILSPQPAAQRVPTVNYRDSDSESDAGGVDLQGDVLMNPSERHQSSMAHQDAMDEILTPGSLITSNPQWMR